VRYTKPETLRDDALHETNYAELIGLRMLQSMLDGSTLCVTQRSLAPIGKQSMSHR
jgi:hypothetical protein